MGIAKFLWQISHLLLVRDVFAKPGWFQRSQLKGGYFQVYILTLGGSRGADFSSTDFAASISLTLAGQ